MTQLPVHSSRKTFPHFRRRSGGTPRGSSRPVETNEALSSNEVVSRVVTHEPVALVA